MLQSVLAPAGLFIQADTQRRLRDNFMREKGIRWMNAAQARLPCPYGQNSRRARCPTHELHFNRRFMINQAR